MVTAAQPSVIDQAALATFIANASLDRHLRQMRRRYRAKRDQLFAVLNEQLPEARVSGAAGGLHLLATLPEGADESATANKRFQKSVTRAPVLMSYRVALLLGST
jgi:GntR family transcriptional regulator/MocR family aminotransferase